MKKGVKLEIIALMPTFFTHCTHCMTAMKLCELSPISSQLEEYPADVRELYFKVSNLVQNIWRDFGNKVSIQVIDKASMPGLWKVIRYRIKQTPVFIINGRKIFETTPSYEELKRELINVGVLP